MKLRAIGLLAIVMSGCASALARLRPSSTPSSPATTVTILSSHLWSSNRADNLYGTARNGGGGPCLVGSFAGCGMIYQLSRPAEPGGAWTENVIWRFQSGTDGGDPGGLVVAEGKFFDYPTADRGCSGANRSRERRKARPGMDSIVLERVSALRVARYGTPGWWSSP
jgi:hypothetical protein